MFLYREESDKILGAFFEINKHLPRGLLEAVYEKAMVYELRQCGLIPDEQKQLIVKYKGMNIGYKGNRYSPCSSVIVRGNK